MNTLNVAFLTLLTVSGVLLEVSSVLAEEVASTTPTPHRHRHEKHRNRLRHSTSTEMPLSIPPLPVPKAAESVTPNPAIEKKPVHAPKRLRKRAHPPSYLNMIYDNLMASSENSFGSGNLHHRPIVRAVRPKKISHAIRETSVITFKLNRDKIGIFNSAQIIFTLKDGLEDFHDGSHFTVNAHFRHRQEKETKLIWKNTKYYEFDLSAFLKSSLDNQEFGNELEQIPLKLEVTVFQNNRRKQVPMAELFDLHQDKPFLFLQYVDHIPPSEEDMASSSSEEHNSLLATELSRRKRSLIAPLTNQPEEIQGIDEQDQSSSTSADTSERFMEPMNETLAGESSSTTILNYSAIRRARRNRTLGRSRSRRRQSKNNDRKVVPVTSNPRLTACRRHEWLVKPADVGLTEVLRPALLELGYCAGSCPFPLQNDVFNFTLHSYFVDRHRILHGFDVPQNFPNSNCVPVSYKEIMILEAEGSGYVVYVHQDGSVASCGCR